MTAVASRGRRSGVRSRSRRGGATQPVVVGGRIRRLGRVDRAHAQRPRRSARPPPPARRRSPTGCPSSRPAPWMSGLSNSRQTSSNIAQPPASDDRDAVAARQVEALLLRARPHEEDHRDRHQQDRGLDEREHAERGHVGLDDLPCPEVATSGTRAARTRAPARSPRRRRAAAPSADGTGPSASSSDRDVLHLALARRRPARAGRSSSRARPAARSAARAARPRPGAAARAGAGRGRVHQREQRREVRDAARRRPCRLPQPFGGVRRPPRRARPPRPWSCASRTSRLGGLVGLAVGLSHARTPRSASLPRASREVGL